MNIHMMHTRYTYIICIYACSYKYNEKYATIHDKWKCLHIYMRLLPMRVANRMWTSARKYMPLTCLRERLPATSRVLFLRTYADPQYK